MRIYPRQRRNNAGYTRKYKLAFSLLGQVEAEHRSDWTDEVVMELIDDLGHSLYEFNSLKPLEDLYRIIKYEMAEVDEFIQEVLATEI